MPADLLRRINLDLIFPPLLDRLFRVLAACRSRKADYVATSGFRSFAEQFHLRQAYLEGKGGRAAPAGQSAHQFGLAVDFCRDADIQQAGLQPDWRAEAYAILGEEAEREGLVWGGRFRDHPHVQWPKYVTGVELAPLVAEWKRKRGTTGGPLPILRDVWQIVRFK